MVAQARARNAIAVKNGRVELLHGTVDDLRFAGDTFHKAIAIKHSPASVVCSKASRAPHSEFANSGVGSEKHVSVATRDMLQS